MSKITSAHQIYAEYVGTVNENNPVKCDKSIIQKVRINVPVDVVPCVSVGQIESQCVSKPLISVERGGNESTAVILITQEISLKIPVTYDFCAKTPEEYNNCESIK